MVDDRSWRGFLRYMYEIDHTWMFKNVFSDTKKIKEFYRDLKDNARKRDNAGEEPEKVLIIWDDMIGDKEMDSHNSFLSGDSSRQRHYNITSFFLT